MARRINEGAARSRRREAQRVVDDSALRLVPAGQSREDRQACRIGRRPGRGADAVRAQAPSRACPGVPAASGVREPAELVEPARVPVEEQRVMVASVLDVNPLRDRVTHAVALVRVLEQDPCPRRVASDHVERDPDRAAVPGSGAEVGVKPGVEPDRADQRPGIRCDRQLVDAPVPGVRLREDGAARRAGQSERGRGTGQSGDENGCGEDVDGSHTAYIGATAGAP